MQVVVFPIASAKAPTICGVFGDPRQGHTHAGVDLCCPRGTPVLSAHGGVVSFGVDPLGGLVAIVRAPDGSASYYAHLSETVGASGRPIEPGEWIGRVGTSGDATGGPAHLHFELWPTGQPASAVDPWPLLSTAQRFADPPGSLGHLTTAQAVVVAVGVVGFAALLGYTILGKGPLVQLLRA